MNKQTLNKWLIVGTLCAFGCQQNPKVVETQEPNPSEMNDMDMKQKQMEMQKKQDQMQQTPRQKNMMNSEEGCSSCGYSTNEAPAQSESAVQKEEVAVSIVEEKSEAQEAKIEVVPVAEIEQN